MKTTALKNGSFVPTSMLTGAVINLRAAFNEHHDAAVALYDHALHPDHLLDAKTVTQLQDHNLLDKNGNLDPDVAKVLLAGAEGEGKNMKFGAPAAPRVQAATP